MKKRITNRLWLAVNQQLRCYWCNQLTRPKMGWQNSATTEHLIPKSAGGIHIAPNVVSACTRCNRLRGVECAEQFKLKAAQFESDTRRVAEAVAEERALEKALGVKKAKKIKADMPVPAKPLNSDARALNDLMLVKQALWRSSINPFEPGTRCHRWFEKRSGRAHSQTVDQTDPQTS